MPAELSERGERMMRDLPPYYSEDPNALAYVDACARELDRLEERLLEVRDGLFAGLSTGGVLDMWERQLGLPIAPPGVSEDARREFVLAMVRKAGSGEGRSWVAKLTRAIRGTNWTHAENTPDDYRLTLMIPYGGGTGSASLVEAIARRLTPANLELITGYDEGFIVGVSEVGEPI